jgi:hypothetical protein
MNWIKLYILVSDVIGNAFFYIDIKSDTTRRLGSEKEKKRSTICSFCVAWFDKVKSQGSPYTCIACLTIKSFDLIPVANLKDEDLLVKRIF